jgi:membrane fusion protein (multidrug efflux system)
MMHFFLLSSLYGCGWATADQAVPEHAIPDASATRVEVLVLERADVSLELALPGEVEGSRDALLAAANGGYVERVHVANGDRVTQGQALLSVDAQLYGAQLEQAEAQLEQAEVELSRVEAMGDLTSQSRLDSARTQTRVARAATTQARARHSRSVVRAPFDGTIADMMVETGEAAAPGAAVVRLVTLDPVRVVLSVSDRDVVALRSGVEVKVSTAASSADFSGVISDIAPAADLRTRTFPVGVLVPNPDQQLLPGMIARVDLDLPMDADTVVIPQDWLVTRRDRRGVFVDEDNLARWRDISLGDIIHDDVVVTAGLSDGDRVVVTGHQDLVEGDALLIAREGRCCTDGRAVYGE